MIVADSDVLIDALRGREPGCSLVLSALESGTLATTAVTGFELLSGGRTAVQRAAIEALLGAIVVLPFDERASKAAAKCRSNLESRGQGIGMADYLIAGICISRALTLVTRNRKHFDRVPGLLVVSP